MVKIQKISEIEPRLGFTEFDMLKKYRQSFATSELGRLHALFPFSELARQMHLKSSALGRKSYFSPEGKIALMVLKSYTNFSDDIFREISPETLGRKTKSRPGLVDPLQYYLRNI